MKKFEITKEQLQTIEADGCTYIKEWFPEAFKKELEVGKWYKNGDEGRIKSIGFVSEICPTNDTNFKGFGFDMDGYWVDKTNCFDFGSYNWIEATQQEVEGALINEANRRGYSNENTICLLNSKEEKITDSFYFNNYENILYSAKKYQGGKVLFKDGQWATIIDETLNNPVLSLNDLLSVWDDKTEIDVIKTSPLFKSFEKLAKSKIV